MVTPIKQARNQQRQISCYTESPSKLNETNIDMNNKNVVCRQSPDLVRSEPCDPTYKNMNWQKDTRYYKMSHDAFFNQAKATWMSEGLRCNKAERLIFPYSQCRQHPNSPQKTTLTIRRKVLSHAIPQTTAKEHKPLNRPWSLMAQRLFSLQYVCFDNAIIWLLNL